MENPAEKTDDEFLKELETEKKELLNRAKEEILTKYEKGEDVTPELFAIKESYRIGNNLKKQPDRPSLVSSKQNNFLRTISKSLVAMDELKAEYPEKVIPILSDKPIQEWPEIVKKTLYPPSTAKRRWTT